MSAGIALLGFSVLASIVVAFGICAAIENYSRWLK